MSNALEQIVNKSETSKAIFKNLSSRKRFRSRTDLRKLHRDLSKEKVNLNEKDFTVVFKALQDLGVGSIIEGRNNNPDRFAWNYSLRDVTARINEKKAPAVGKIAKPTKPEKSNLDATTLPSKDITGLIADSQTGRVKAFTVKPENHNLLLQILLKLGTVE